MPPSGRDLIEPHVVLSVDEIVGNLARVLLHQGAFAAGEIDAVKVVPGRVAIVHTDHHRVRALVTDTNDVGARVSYGVRSRDLPLATSTA